MTIRDKTKIQEQQIERKKYADKQTDRQTDRQASKQNDGVGDRQKEEKRQRKDGKMDYIHKERQRTKDGLTMKEQQTEGKKKQVGSLLCWMVE